MAGVERYIEAHADEFLGELKDLCRIPSVAGNAAALAAAAAWIERVLRRDGARTELFEFPDGPPIVCAEAGDGPVTLLVYNHYDVQHPEPLDRWRTEPFEPSVAGGRLYCRGANDDKGNLMARIHAVRALAAAGGLPLKVKFLVEGEEESGAGERLARFVRGHAELLRADGCLWELSWKDAKGRPIVTCGLKGHLAVELTARGARTDMHSSNAAIVPNPAWRLVHALASLLDAGDRISIDGWTDEVRALTPAEEKAVRRIPFDEEGFRAQHGLRGFVRGLTGGDLVREYLYAPTCAICGLHAGYTGPGSKTVLPAEASAKLDFRFVPDMTSEAMLARLRRHLDARGFADVEVRSLGRFVPAATGTGDAIVEAAAAAARETSGREPIVYPVAPWSGPLGEVCGTLGIPSVAFGIGNPESNDHAPNENIVLDDYFEGIRCMAAFMRRYAAARRRPPGG
ncbi:MAG: M20/M25/M40 family metallo-hydrolase [bacterium]|nr:M20/M25/M40 family metallo-hydrolase [bacterium]